MLDPKQFNQIISQHFAEVTPEQFKENLAKFCPEILDNELIVLEQDQYLKNGFDLATSNKAKNEQ